MSHYARHVVFLIAIACAVIPAIAAQSRRAGNVDFLTCVSRQGLSKVSPSVAAFDKYSVPFNKRISPNPIAAFVPKSTADVQTIVKCAATASDAPPGGFKVNALSGGHSYGAYGIVDGHIVVDMQKLNAVSLNGNIATVGPGARLGNLATTLAQAGRALPHGTCPGVGVGGHIHGGFGLTGRNWGLTIDRIIEATVVLSNGSAVTASANKNPDLFFGIRGAPSSIGLVTSLKFNTLPAPNTNVHWSFSYNRADLTVNKAADLFSKVQAWAITTPPKELSVAFYQDATVINFNGVFHNRTVAQFHALLDPLVATLPKPSSTSISTARSWVETLEILAGGPLATDATYAFTTHDTFYAKSIVLPESKPMDIKTLRTYFNVTLNTATTYNWFNIANLYGGANSQINQKPLLAQTSYGDRSALWVIQFYSSSTVPGAWNVQDGFKQLDSIREAFTKSRPDVRFGSYANYVDTRLTRKVALEQIYGAPPEGGQTQTQLQKLRAVKVKYDPLDLINYAQSVDIL